MNTNRLKSAPKLPGFEFIEFIGSGGYADVFLYQQIAPRRQVAIKIVDNAGLDNRTATDYTEEANVMAMVSAHPHIVQVFQASVSPDGRPFLVMEYYPNQNFQDRARSEQMSVAEVLRVGIQIASAVETAHRAGILHRDIKPANILTSEFNHPGLTDFGIAVVAGRSDQTGDGLSIPWSPPEALGEAPTLVQSDVYSLAATIYTMLAGRAPFEIKGGDNRPLAMMARIERDPVPPVGRPDVPELLERVLIGALSKDPLYRPATAADFARQLQEVETWMQLPVTPLQLRDNSPVARTRVSDHTDEEATRVKNVTSIDAQKAPAPPAQLSPTTSERPPSSTPLHNRTDTAPPVPGKSVGSAEASAPLSEQASSNAPAAAPSKSADSPPADRSSAGRVRVGLLPEPEVGDTVRRVDAPPTDLPEYERPRSTPKLWLAIVGIAAVVLLVVGVMQVRGDKPKPQPETATAVTDPPPPIGSVVSVSPLPIEKITAEQSSENWYKFSWAPANGTVTYAVSVDGDPTTETVTATEYETASKCIEVAVVASSGVRSAPTRGCFP